MKSSFAIPPIIPSVGRIVHFVMPDGQHRPAIIVRVWTQGADAAKPDSLVNLQVFTDGSNDNRGSDSAAPLISWKTSVHQDAAGVQTGTWHAPERIAEHLAELAGDIQELNMAYVGIPRSEVEGFANIMLALCYQIEACGASPGLTQASVIASKLNQWFQGLLNPAPETIVQPLQLTA